MLHSKLTRSALKPLAALFLVLCWCSASSGQTTTNILDNFNRNGNLAGSSPVIGDTNLVSTNWVCNTTYTTTNLGGGGMVITVGGGGTAAYVPLQVANGYVYTISVTQNISATVGTGDRWGAVGFDDGSGYAGNTLNTKGPWMLMKATGHMEAYYNGLSSIYAGDGAGNAAGNNNLLQIVLDTTTPTAWTAAIKVNGVSKANKTLPSGFTASRVIFFAYGAANLTNSGFSVTSTKPTAPIMSLQPVGITNWAGVNGSLTTAASGAPPLSFQWYLGSTSSPLTAKTNSTLNFTPLAGANSGSYFVIITNYLGSVTSSVAVVHVETSSVMVLTPSISVGAIPASGSDAASGISSTNTYLDALNFTASGTPLTINGVTFSPVSATGTSASGVDSVNGGSWALSMTSVQTPTFHTATLTNGLSDGSLSNLLSYAAQLSGSVQIGDSITLTFSNLVAAGQYRIRLFYAPLSTNALPVTFTFNGRGSNEVVNLDENLGASTNSKGAYYVDYAFTATTNSFASATLATGVAGTGAVLAGAALQQISVPATLSLATDTTASPSTNVYTGSTVTLSASFSGTKPITNQWEVNTGSGFVPITGATNTTLTLTNLQLTDSGASYELFASNPAGSSNSTPVTLSVLALPTNSLGINVQFTGSWAGGGNCPTYTGAAVIGGGADVWNAVSNPTGGTSPAGLARGTNLVLFDTGSITTPITMDYVADYVFSGAYDPGVNPFKAAGSPVAPLMTGYMGSVSQGSTADTNTITLRHLVPGIYDLYLYGCGRSDGQTRVDVYAANGQSAVCGPNNGDYSLDAGVNYVHLTPTVTTNGVLNISYYGTTDAGQGLLNGFQLNGPDTNISLAISSDTSCDSPLNDYVGRTVTFSAAFAGSPAPALQWEVDYGSGYVLIPGATNSVLTLANLQTTNTGSYALFATNAAAGINSTPLALNVTTLPSPLAINVQFDGTTYTGSHAAAQVGGAEIGGSSDYWNPVSNPNPTVGDTNLISGSLVLLDVNDYGTPMSLTYTGASLDYNNGKNTPFHGSSSPAANLMQASLVTLNSNTASVTMQGIPAGVYDLYLYSCDSSNLQQNVTRFSANDSYDTSGPNDTNSDLILETNYVHLTPTVTANGLLTISFTGTANGRGNLNGVQLSGPGATILPPVAGFTATPTNVFTTQSVAFTDTSSGNITNWVWNFGDGNSVTNTSGSASYAYAAAGIYTVSLSVSGSGGASAVTNTAYIVVTYPAPVAGFSGTPTNGAAPLTVVFTNTSSGSFTNSEWTFGDGNTATNVSDNVTNTYAAAGSYTVSLIVAGPGGIGTLTNTAYIVVTNAAPLLSTNALLSNLSISPGTLSQTFSSGVFSYTATNTYPATNVTVKATSPDGTAALALSFNGTLVGSLTSGVASGNNTMSLNQPANVLAVQVVSQDGSQTNVYTVNELLQPSQTVPKLTNSVSGNNLVLSWPADHLGYRLLVQTNNLNKGVSANISDWGTVAGSTTNTSMSIPIIKATNNAYYRLVYP